MQEKLLLSVKKLYKENHQEGNCPKLALDYFFTMPSPDTYPFQWFWDSCFHAIVLSKFDVVAAKKEILSLLKLQQSDGFIPHVIFWRDIELPDWTALERHPSNDHITAMIQPPVLTLAIEKIYEASGDVEFLQETLPKAQKFHDYLRTARDPDRDNLISIVQSRESGLDFSPQYDKLFGNPETFEETMIASDKIFRLYQGVNWDLDKIFASDVFNVEDLLINVVYVKALEASARLYLELGNQGQADIAADEAKLVESAIINKMWSKEDKSFYSLAGKNEKHLKVKTISSMLPLWLNLPIEIEKQVITSLTNASAFSPEYPVPSVALSESSFDQNPTPWLWRGPTWLNTNWMLYHALKEKKYLDLAEELKSKSLELVEISGFREYYNPVTGEGGGAHSFAWSTLVLDMN